LHVNVAENINEAGYSDDLADSDEPMRSVFADRSLPRVAAIPSDKRCKDMGMTNRSPKEIDAQLQLLFTEPERYIALKSREISEDARDSHAYFGRYQGWLRLGNLEQALADISASIALEEQPISYLCRGEVLCRLGRYETALEDFNKGEQLDPVGWPDLWGPLHQADCHSRLGHATEALAACTKLKDDHWTPGLDGTPAGNKQEVIAEVRRRLAALRT
jgi:tetratricopeptide (TPR) repeat protein